MRDPNFDRTVIFVLEHGPEGALGLIINRPSELPVAGTIDEWAVHAAIPATIFIGGPVSTSSVIALATADPKPTTERWSPITGRIGTVDLEGDPKDVPGLGAVRLFAGYAGWEAGQLEGELLLESWFVIEARAGDITDSEPATLWSRVLGRQPGALGRLKNYPDDPWVN